MRQEEGKCGETGSVRGCWHGREVREQPGGEEQGGAPGRKRGGETARRLGRGEPQAHVIRVALGRVGGMRERSHLQTAAPPPAAGLGPLGSQQSTGDGRCLTAYSLGLGGVGGVDLGVKPVVTGSKL